MRYLYIYIENDKVNDAIKYGMKLSEYSNKILETSTERKGIIAYLTPKDCEDYNNENFSCLKINCDNLNIFVYNQVFENTEYFENFIYEYKKYTPGLFEEPIALICSTILPENIEIYNKILDTPNIIETSKDFYYQKSINEMLESDYFTNYELYQMLLILGKQKNIFDVENITDKIKLYTNKYNKNKYSKKSNF